MTIEDVQRWLDGYVEAWRGMERDTIGSLFTDDAAYAYQPWAEPVRGRRAIVDAWMTDPDPPGSWEARYRPLVIDGDLAVAAGETRYSDGKVYSNMFVLRLNSAGQCAEFTEWYMLQPTG